MRNVWGVIWGLALALGPAAWADEGSSQPLPRKAAEGAQLLDGLGTYHRPISTRTREAQAYFDQGLRLLYGFNHDEAFRSFAKAAELDPSCAMCFWGATYALGPNYNMPMLPDRAQMAWDALEAAVQLAPAASPVEQALIGALTRRHKGPQPLAPKAQQPLNEAFASAMRDVAQRFPKDVDVQTLFAESLMDLNPWKLWTQDGKPGPHTEEILATLESVLDQNPVHPGANHYYIHATEASPNPEKALASAERLKELMPGAGHLVHMPSHTYQRIGRYEDAAEANRRAIEADRVYLEAAKPSGYYPMYTIHNYGFLAQSAAVEGRSAEALQAARQGAALVTPHMTHMMPGSDFARTPEVFVRVRFGRWDELIALPSPPESDLNSLGIWHFGQGMAYAAKGQVPEAERALQNLTRLRGGMPPELPFDLNSARDVLGVAADTLAGHIAWAKGNVARAQLLLARAVRKEDALSYAEPPDWFYPVRHHQGAVLLRSGEPKAAEAVFRQDLVLHPKNGWALFGLWQSLEAQGRTREAAEVRGAFEEAWSRADVKLRSPAFIGPKGKPAQSRRAPERSR